MKKRKFIVLLVVLLLMAITFVWANNRWITVSEYSISSPDVPAVFDGVRIVQISDLHNATFGEDQSALMEKVTAAEPDIIFVTGDLVDKSRYDIESAVDVVNRLTEITEVYFVTGNHEIAQGRSKEVLEALSSTEMIILENEMVEWVRDGEEVYIAGIHDPLLDASIYDPLIGVDFHDPQVDYTERAGKYTRESLKEISFTDKFTVLLAHRPEYIEEYAETGADVVFSGHAHGGQIRIPGVGGLFAPGQGLFPVLTEGVVRLDNTQLVISRGLGNSSFPLRILNRPEIVVVTLNRG